MGLVKFNMEQEFISEMQADAAAEIIYRGIVRLTKQYTSTATAPIKHLEVIASYEIADEGGVLTIVRLERYCGQYWGEGFPESEQVQIRADAVMNAVRKAAESEGLEIRPGIVEAAG